MADDLNVAYGPDEELAKIFANRSLTSEQRSELISKKSAEIMKTINAPSIGIGGYGFFTPNLNTYKESDTQNTEYYQQQEKLKQDLAGKSILQPTLEKGVYSASTFDTKGNLVDVSTGKTSDPAAKGTEKYDPNATNERFFYDASGKKLTPAQAAATSTGKEFAAAGWDIGYGPGYIAPGVKAESQVVQSKASRARVIPETYPNTEIKPTPITPSVIQQTISTPNVVIQPPVKTAPIDTVLFNDDLVPVETMTDLIFEDIGGQELINIVRSDLIDGQKLDYVPVKNITNIQQQYNPNNILSLQNTSDKYFSNFNISLDDKIPYGATSTGLAPGDPFIYIDSNTGNLVIELANLAQDNEIQVSFMSGGTIYELEIDES